MTQFLKSIIRGAGTIATVWPDSDYRNYYKRLHPTPWHAISQDWANVGLDFRASIDNTLHAQKEIAAEQESASRQAAIR